MYLGLKTIAFSNLFIWEDTVKIFKKLFFKKILRAKYSKDTLNEIRNTLAECSRKQISIVECVSNTAPLTAELIFLYSPDVSNKRIFDTILIMITNYYVMLYIDLYTGFYTVSRNHTCNMVSSMVEEVLKETAKKHKGLKTNDPQSEIQRLRYFTYQMVEVYYNTGIEDCHRFAASSIYWVLQSENKNPSLKRDKFENIVRAIQAEKYLTSNYNDLEFSLENNG
ncbi:MAG: hypothetical protein WD512_13925 [Candidatus Paceibacterota bacterium]